MVEKMRFPNLPTDNLYKFMALSGLILFVFSFFVPFWLMHNIKLKTLEIKEELDLLDIEEKYLKEIHEDIEALPSNKRRKAIKLNEERFKDYSKKLMQTRRKVETMKYLDSMRRDIRILALVGISLGVIFTYCGFFLWYKRLQKYQDQIIKNEAQKQLQNNSKKE